VRYDLGVDIWSIGCIFFELAEGHILFQTESEIGQIMEILRQQGTPTVDEWKTIIDLPFFKVKHNFMQPTFPKFKKIRRSYSNLSRLGIDLLERMVEVNPNQRINIKEVVNHPYFSQ
jgi:serine/threonine protein kinase